MPLISRVESSFGVRGLRVLQGEGMVTAARPVTVTYPDGSTETHVPGRTRFAPEHELVQARPELFRLCCKDDRTDTPEVFRQALRSADRDVERQLTEAGGERPRARSSSTGREPWRL
jgi:hypothetical protein